MNPATYWTSLLSIVLFGAIVFLARRENHHTRAVIISGTIACAVGLTVVAFWLNGLILLAIGLIVVSVIVAIILVSLAFTFKALEALL